MHATTIPQYPPTLLRQALDARDVSHAKRVLCDLDGCLISEGRPYADAAEFIAECGSRLWVVSNNSDTTGARLSAQLATLGLDIPARRILLAGEVALHRIARLGVTRLCLHASPALVAAARDLGFDTTHPAPQAALLCRDPAFGIDDFGPLLSLAARGAPLWVANEDLSHPSHSGQPIAETGALLAALRAIRPALCWHSPGKPDPLMLTLALGDTAPAQAMFVGDNPATDGRAARAAGLPFLHLQRPAAVQEEAL
ncbi:HAD hydrolase-like protein [Pseudooceanicola sediminis]|uniref:HAD hydrolase-like protein n=1 Tax=Pseudooceanicola sediminis TaxID=2211117 RepID=UPI0013141ABA|nr:HAD hydrolase-like protein [Pseudooceanicola sediminis]